MNTLSAYIVDKCYLVWSLTDFYLNSAKRYKISLNIALIYVSTCSCMGQIAFPAQLH